MPGGGPGARGASGWGGGGRWWHHQTPRHPPRAAWRPSKPPPSQPGPGTVRRRRGRAPRGGPPGHLGPGSTRERATGVLREGEDPVGRPRPLYRRRPAAPGWPAEVFQKTFVWQPDRPGALRGLPGHQSPGWRRGRGSGDLRGWGPPVNRPAPRPTPPDRGYSSPKPIWFGKNSWPPARENPA